MTTKLIYLDQEVYSTRLSRIDQSLSYLINRPNVELINKLVLALWTIPIVLSFLLFYSKTSNKIGLKIGSVEIRDSAVIFQVYKFEEDKNNYTIHLNLYRKADSLRIKNSLRVYRNTRVEIASSPVWPEDYEDFPIINGLETTFPGSGQYYLKVGLNKICTRSPNQLKKGLRITYKQDSSRSGFQSMQWYHYLSLPFWNMILVLHPSL